MRPDVDGVPEVTPAEFERAWEARLRRMARRAQFDGARLTSSGVGAFTPPWHEQYATPTRRPNVVATRPSNAAAWARRAGNRARSK